MSNLYSILMSPNSWQMVLNFLYRSLQDLKMTNFSSFLASILHFLCQIALLVQCQEFGVRMHISSSSWLIKILLRLPYQVWWLLYILKHLKLLWGISNISKSRANSIMDPQLLFPALTNCSNLFHLLSILLKRRCSGLPTSYRMHTF